MLFEQIKASLQKKIWPLASVLILFVILFGFITNCINIASKANQDIFAFTIKVRDSVEELDKVFERAEVNVNVMVDSIANSYDTSRQGNEAYNVSFVNATNGLVKSVLVNSPNVDGSWFQLNADLPFSSHAYNWYEFKDNQFIDVKDQFAGKSSLDRKLTPEEDPYYFGAILNRKATWSDIYTDADTNNSMMTISSPIYKESSLVGVVGIDIATTNLQQILKSMQAVLGDSDLYLLNKKNTVILSQLLDNSNSDNNNFQFLDLFKENKTGPIEYYDHLTKKTAIMMTLSNDYKIVIAIKNKSLFNGTNQLIYTIYLLFILLIISTLIALISCLKVNPNKRIEVPQIGETTKEEAEEKTDSDILN